MISKAKLVFYFKYTYWWLRALAGFILKRRKTLKSHYVHPLQMEMYLKSMKKKIKPGQKSVAFFCPDQAFRKIFGEIPRLLEEKGYAVFYLYGTKCHDEFEKHSTSFYVGGGILDLIDFIDIYFTGTIMDCLPRKGKRALVIHGSFAPFAPEGFESSVDDLVDDNLPLEKRYDFAVSKRTHFSAYFRLYDFYIVSSPHFKDAIEQIAGDYGLRIVGQESKPLKQPHQHFKIFNEIYKKRNHKLPEQIYILPTGYPQIDTNYRKSQNYSGPVDSITFAPTPLNGKPVWTKLSSLAQAGEAIITALLENFPQYRIVFKPHITDINEATLSLIEKFSKHPNFVLDKSGSNHGDLYARTKVLISDFSSTAYTYAVSNQRPVLFYSANEDLMDHELKQQPYCRLRTEVGLVACQPQEMVQKLNVLLSSLPEYKLKIQKFSETHMYNLGGSEAYIANMMSTMLSDQADSSWTTIKNNY